MVRWEKVFYSKKKENLTTRLLTTISCGLVSNRLCGYVLRWLDVRRYFCQKPKKAIVKTDQKRMLLLDNCYNIVSGHFFAICIVIFHKTEVQTVILKYLTGLNCNSFKSYGLRCSRRLRASSVNFWKIASDKWPFYDHIWVFFWKLH